MKIIRRKSDKKEEVFRIDETPVTDKHKEERDRYIKDAMKTLFKMEEKKNEQTS
jgi:hypothetical protein